MLAYNTVAVVAAVLLALLVGSPRAAGEVMRPAHGDDGGEGALPLRAAAPDGPPGLDRKSVEEVTLLSVVAKHFSLRHSRVPTEAGAPRERLRLHRWSHYWRVYEELLRPIRHKPGAVFVEVGGMGGGSAQVWSEWLGPEVDVHIVDIDDLSPMMRGVRVTSWQADQANASFWRDVFFPTVGKIDALIDDGGHTATQQTVTVREVLPWVKPGGVLAVEDTHTSFMLPQRCGASHEMELVRRSVQQALAREGLQAQDFGRGIPAWVDPSFRGMSVSALANELASTRFVCPGLSEKAVLPTWSFVDEMTSLTTDLHEWWIDDSSAPTLSSDMDGNHYTQPGGQQPGAEALHMARTLRGSLLGRSWRHWFARNVASVRFYESIVVLQRWWDEGGRGPPTSMMGGSVEARDALLGGMLTPDLAKLPVGARAVVPGAEARSAMGAHFTSLIDEAEAQHGAT